MNIHEYQAKELLQAVRRRGAATGHVAWTPEEAEAAARKLPGPVYVVKSQIHAGGRGAGRFADDPNGKGGVRLARSPEEVRAAAEAMIGHTLVTKQTGPAGRKVRRVYVEAGCDIARELYLSLLVDRATARITIVASTEGGMEIEEVAAQHPEKILRVAIDPATGISGFHARKLAFGLGPAGQADRRVRQVHRRHVQGLHRARLRRSSRSTRWSSPAPATWWRSMPRSASTTTRCSATRISRSCATRPRRTRRSWRRRKHDLNYIALDGTIGCMVNGAGLAMATMDIIKLYGASPANFLDVGGGATKERVTAAFKIILSDPNVEGILVNIFGGIMRCDVIAEGVVAAAREVSLNVPLVVRLEGTNVELGKEILAALRPADHFGRQPRRRRRKGGQGRAGGRVMAILVDKNTQGHHPGLHRRAGHVPFRAGDRLRHQDGRRRHAGQGRHARISTCRCSTPWPRRWRRPAPTPPASTCRRPSPPTRSWRRSTPECR